MALLFQRFVHAAPLRDLGLRWCRPSDALGAGALAVLIPLMVLLVDLAAGLVEVEPLRTVPNPAHPESTGISAAGLIGIVAGGALVTTVGALLTEELAFRGYLITRLRRHGPWAALVLSSILFGIWHLPASLFVLHSEWSERLIYLVDITLVGVLLGVLLLDSRSLIPPALFHGIWNALDYTFFGYGGTRGIITGSNRMLFDPDEGLVGTVILLSACVGRVALSDTFSRRGPARAAGAGREPEPGRETGS